MAEEQANTQPEGNPDDIRLRKWKSEFSMDFKNHKKWWDQKHEWEKFYDGDQLDADEKSELQKRGQPEVVINLIKPRIDGVVGSFLANRVMMRARDKGSGDFEKAKYITEALRYIEDQNRFDEAEFRVAEDLFISGMGWYKEHLEFDFMEPEIRISYRSNNDVIVDRQCRRRDLKDAKRLYETVWVEVEDLIELYPTYADEIQACANMAPQELVPSTDTSVQKIGDNYAQSNNVSADTWDFETFVDIQRKRLRLVNVWEREQKKTLFAFHPALENSVIEITDMSKGDLSDFKKIYKNAQYFTRTRWQLNSGIFIANTILEDKKNVRPHDSDGKFPFARAVAQVDRETYLPYGMVKQYVDPQKEYNKRRSKLLHKTNVNRIIAERGAVEDIDLAREEAARPDGYVEINPNKKFDIGNSTPSQSDVYLLQLAQSEIESSGIAKETIGQEDKVMSGTAIQLRQVDGQKMLRSYYASLRSARRDIFAIVLEEMQQFWTSEKLIKITDDPRAGEIILNQRITDPRTGEVFIRNDLRLGKYDIKIDEDLETPNQRDETFRSLTSLAPAIVQSGTPFPIVSLLRASNLPIKEDLISEIEAEKQRQLQIAQANAQMALAKAAAGAAQSGKNVSPTSMGG